MTIERDDEKTQVIHMILQRCRDFRTPEIMDYEQLKTIDIKNDLLRWGADYDSQRIKRDFPRKVGDR